MNLRPSADTAPAVTIHPDTRLGAVELTVRSLQAQVEFHQDVLGMQLHWQSDGRAGIGAGGEDLFRFVERAGAVTARRSTGLYHTAILLPTKWDLAQLLVRIHERRAPMQGMSDHGTHLALYLPDAEGNGIELAWDRSREVWPDLATILKEGTPAAMRRLTAPLDVDDLLSALKDDSRLWPGMPSGTQVGHVHLHVADLRATQDFYQGLLGFDTTMQSDKFGMAFFSAGGYHHHIGSNIWNGAGAPPPPENAAGLRHFTVVLPDAGALDVVVERLRRSGQYLEDREDGYLVRDPSQNGVRLSLAA